MGRGKAMTQLAFIEIPEAQNPVFVKPHKTYNPNNLGYSKHPLFGVYHGMLSRCHNPNQENYRFYGAIGIFVCDEWRDGIPNFIADMGESYPGKGYEIDRVDSSGPYCKTNCRWIKKAENIARMNSSRLVMRYRRKARP